MGRKFRKNLQTYLSAQFSLFHIETPELAELRADVVAICKTLNKSCFTYTLEDGGILKCLYWSDGTKESPTGAEKFNKRTENVRCTVRDFLARIVADPLEKSSIYALLPANSVFVISGLEGLLKQEPFAQAIIEGVACERYAGKQIKASLILTAPILTVPENILKYSTPLVFDLPTEDEILSAVNKEVKVFIKGKGFTDLKEKLKLSDNLWYLLPDSLAEVAHAMRGMTLTEAKNTLRLCEKKWFQDETLNNVLSTVSEQKAMIIQKSKALKFIPYEEQPDRGNIGGFENLLDFIAVRSKAFSEKAETLNIDTPKGIVLLGIPGTGKSLAAKAVGKMLNLPVIIMDIGSLFNQYVGASENRVRQELERIDAVDGCVLLIDEADKAFAGSNGSSTGDSGVSQRVFGSILSWLQDHKSKTFTIITMNKANTVPPEFLRAGRFDKIFFTGLPSRRERKEIIDLHFRKRGVTLAFTDEDWDEILKDTENFVGAELEAVVQDSRYTAFADREKGLPTLDELKNAIKDRHPMYQFQKTEIDNIISWYETHASAASK